MELLFAIDGGGTHSRFGIYDAQGKLLNACEGEGLNLVSEGAALCAQRIVRAAGTLFPGQFDAVTPLYGSLAGGGGVEESNALAAALSRPFPAAAIGITTDLHS